MSIKCGNQFLVSHFSETWHCISEPNQFFSCATPNNNCTQVMIIIAIQNLNKIKGIIEF